MFEAIRRRLVRDNRIYIMPSGRGAFFLVLIVVMILTAATYNNNLIFILAFFLFAMFIVSMLQTHYNLKGVRLQFAGAEDAFEGERQSVLFQLTQKRARHKRGLVIRLISRGFKTLSRERAAMAADEQVKPVRIEVSAWKRGVHKLPHVVLETHFPLGLFRAWKVFRPAGELVVYPKPAGDRPLMPSEHDEGEHDTGLRTTPDGDFGELKSYLPGESYHQIAWKHYARTGELYSKVHWGAEDRHYRLFLTAAAREERESQLRQLSQWVLQAVHENASFELETPDFKIEPGRGMEQARRCWQALARVPA